MLTTDRLNLFDRPDGKSYLTKSELKELTTAYRELKKIKEQAPVAEFVTLFSTPKGTVEFLGRVPDRKLCDLKEGDLLYKQEAIPVNEKPDLLKSLSEYENALKDLQEYLGYESISAEDRKMLSRVVHVMKSVQQSPRNNLVTCCSRFYLTK